MHAATDRLEFAPPQQPGFVRSLALAIVAHLLLLAALTWGVHWKRESENIAVEAELWSAVPQQAAPKLVEAPPAPPPAPPEKVEVKPPPPPVVKDADIALEREKKRRELEKQRELEKEKQRALEEKLEQKKKADAEKKKQEAREKQLEKDKQEKKELEAKRKTEAEARQQKEADAKRLEAQRLENIKRAQGLAGASGNPTAAGAAQQSSGPSAGYAGRIRGRVKPNIVFTEDIAGNPTAEVEVRTSPDGTIVGRKLLKSSGSKSWDEAVLKAIDKTETLPRDVDGRVPPLMILEFKPKD
ncbi:MAG TPA: cell envelope integrity protein TolA [Burkholderiaceae bacterium]|nr:cell envelope integrity protein TolA [Burkholderiaceae bacterium]